MWHGGHGIDLVTHTRVKRAQLAVAHVIAMRFRQQHQVHIARARIITAGERLSDIVEYAYAGRVFKQRRTVALAALVVV